MTTNIITKDNFLANPHIAIRYAEDFDNLPDSKLRDSLSELFNDMDILSANNGSLAQILARSSPLIWGQSEAAQNIEVLLLSDGSVAKNLARHSKLWRSLPIAHDLSALSIKDWEIGYILAHNEDWLEIHDNSDLFDRILQSDIAGESKAKSALIGLMASNIPALADKPELLDYILSNKDKQIANFMVSGWYVSDTLPHRAGNTGAALFNNKSDIYTAEFLNLIDFTLNSSRQKAPLFEGMFDANFDNPLYNVIMVEQVKLMPSKFKEDKLIKQRTGEIMRFAISGCADRIGTDVIEHLSLKELNLYNEIFESAISELARQGNKEGQLLALISASLFFERISEIYPFNKAQQNYYKQHASELLEEFSAEDLAFIGNIDCGSIREVLSKSVSLKLIESVYGEPSSEYSQVTLY